MHTCIVRGSDIGVVAEFKVRAIRQKRQGCIACFMYCLLTYRYKAIINILFDKRKISQQTDVIISQSVR